MNKWTRVKFQPNLPLKESGRVTASKEHILLSKEAAKEGMVLLKNEKNLLPLTEGTRIALFGKGSFDYVKGGGGSGDVMVSYVHNLYDGLKMQENAVQIYEPLSDFYRTDIRHQYEKGAAPGMTVEPELSPELADGAKAFADVAVVVISRFSGEGWDRSSIECNNEFNPWDTETTMPKISGEVFPDGDFYLTAREKEMLSMVKERFDDIVVVLNIGGIMDLSWVKNDDRISSALLGWQGGMEGGLAMAELLTGKGNPSGKLADTFAADVNDYPSTANFHESFDYVNYTEDIYVGYRYFETLPGAQEKVIYPFGYGLSYTTFCLNTTAMWETEDQIFAEVQVTNTGNLAGKEVVQIYFEAPQGLLKKPARQLAAFAKTRLLQPGETQQIRLSFAKADMASYDDLGKIKKSAYILEKGTYKFYIGTSVRDTKESLLTMELYENMITKQLTAHLVPTSLKERMLSDGSFEELPQSACNDMNECVFEKMEPGTEEGITPAVRCCTRGTLFDNFGRKQFIDVAEGRLSLDDFMEQLSDDDLIHLLGGQPNVGVSNTFGFGNLPDYGVPSIMTADGPAGLRISGECSMNTTAWPCATLLACTWNPALVQQVGQAGAEEVKENNLAVWLTPAVNIHRNPLCGRNFEYYSEDPLVAGMCAAADTRGIQSHAGIGTSIKHFAANNQEDNRMYVNEHISERAMREIYLKGFEIAVKTAQPMTIMSSYNLVNGVHTANSHDLLTAAARDEWGFAGYVMTDWGTSEDMSGLFAYKYNLKYGHSTSRECVLAGNDLQMPGQQGNRQEIVASVADGTLPLGQLQTCAYRILNVVLQSLAYDDCKPYGDQFDLEEAVTVTKA